MKHILLIFMLLFYKAIWAQSTFVKKYHIKTIGLGAESHGLSRVNDSTFIVNGVIFDTLDNGVGTQSVVALWINDFGDSLKWKVVREDDYFYYAGGNRPNGGSFRPFTENKFYSINYIDIAGDPFLLFKIYDDTLGLLRSKVMPCTFGSIYRMIPYNYSYHGGHFYLVGQNAINPTSSVTRGALIVYDTNFNLVKTYDLELANENFLNKGGYITKRYYSPETDQLYYINNILSDLYENDSSLRFDNSGGIIRMNTQTQEFDKYYELPSVSNTFGGKVDFILDGSNFYISASHFTAVNEWRRWQYLSPVLMKVDTLGNLKATYYQKDTSRSGMMYKIYKFDDRIYTYAARYSVIQNVLGRFRIFVFDTNLNKVGVRELDMQFEALNLGTAGFQLRDLITLKDGSHLMTVWADAGGYRMIVIRLDPHFCYEPGCQVNDRFEGDSLEFGESGLIRNDLFHIYPNPAQNELKVLMENDIDQADFVIYNSLGQIVHQSTLYQQEEQSIDFSHFSSGLYVAKLHINGLVLLQRKVAIGN